MPGFESILGQEKPIRLLKTFLRNEAIPHALLFLGIDGVGKTTTAKAFAKACNCAAVKNRHPSEKEDAASIPVTAQDLTAKIEICPGCKSCNKIEKGNHPDIILVEPTGPYIRIDQIRNLCNILAMKPYEARLRVVIIKDAQAMNPAAGNALLKVLEEPPDRTILILTAMQTSDLLPTIVSRCQHIRFNPIAGNHLKTMLVEKQGADPDDAEIVTIMANGSFSKALSMIRHMKKLNWIKRRAWLINEVESLPLMPIPLCLAFAESLSKNKETLTDSLEVIKSWFRDLVVCRFHPSKVINKDIIEKIHKNSKKMTVDSLLSKIEDIHLAQRNIQLNSNLRLTLEVLMMRLART
ncbi:MAG: DNA polymerase III subunit delta' [Desulfobacterales bacterium]|jgi:DNA polymerase-3 subunit delta'